MTGLAGAPFPSTFSRVLAKPTKILVIAESMLYKGNIEFLSHILGSLFWDLMVHCSSERTQAAVMPTAMHFKNRHFWQLRRLATLTWKKA